MTAALALGRTEPPVAAATDRGSADWTERAMTVALAIYFVLYVTEGFTRWLLNMAGLDALIFLRDALVLGALGLVIVRQLLVGRLEAFPVVFALLMTMHGVIGAANLRDVTPVLAGVKPYLSILIGAMAARHLFLGHPRLLKLLAVLWLVGFVSAGVEKYFVDWPWIGMTAEIAGTTVELSKDWQLGETEKRVGGLARSSIHLAGFMSLVGVLLFFRARRAWVRLLVPPMTLLSVFWTTQKGALIAIFVVFAVSCVPKRFNNTTLKLALVAVLALMIALPVILPNYVMPSGAEGVFSLQSFYDRAQRMWPDAWDWYDQRSTPLFGVGMGGIGFAMRLYSPEAAFYAADLASYEPYLINFADNMFVYLYVQLGVMSLFYIALVLVGALRVPSAFDPARTAALGVLVFCVGYGVAVSIIEDQIACMFLGAAAYFLWTNRRGEPAAQAAPRLAEAPSGRPRDIYAAPFRPRLRNAARPAAAEAAT